LVGRACTTNYWRDEELRLSLMLHFARPDDEDEYHNRRIYTQPAAANASRRTTPNSARHPARIVLPQAAEGYQC